MPPSRVHRTRPLLSPTDLPLVRSRPPRPRPSAWRTMPRHVEARHAALCSHLQGLHILDRVEHLIGNKSHRGDSNGRPNRTAPGAVPRQQCTSYGSNALVAKALHCLLSSAMLRQIVHCPRATSSRAARSDPTPLQQAAQPPHRCRYPHHKDDRSIRNEAGATSYTDKTIAKMKNENSP